MVLKKGYGHVAYKVSDSKENELRFVPSRFIGYAYNSVSKHKANNEKDGKDTNPAITSVIKEKLKEDKQLDQKYIEFCRSLGIVPSKKTRKFWSINIGKDFENNTQLERDFPEGALVERTHKKYERVRNNKVIDTAKKRFKIKHSRLYCQVCGFDFESNYGEIGKDFIEAHHTVPVSEMKPGDSTKTEDIAMLCSNCHKMVHRKRPWLSMQDLETIKKLNREQMTPGTKSINVK